MWRDAFQPPTKLSLVKEAQPRRKKRDNCCRLVNGWMKRRSGARFVVELPGAVTAVTDAPTNADKDEPALRAV